MLDPALALLLQCIVEGDNYYRNKDFPSIEALTLQANQLGTQESEFQNGFQELEKICCQEPEMVLDYVTFLVKEHTNN